MIALIDGDIVAYRSAASCEPTKTRPNREIKDVAILRAEEAIRNIVLATKADSYRVFLSGSNNFRKTLYPAYKANRTTPPPSYLADVGSYLILEHNATISDGNEADDELGIWQTMLRNEVAQGYSGGSFGSAPIKMEGHRLLDVPENNPSIISSIDKDLHQIQGRHYNFVTGEFKEVDEKTGLFNFYRQLIFGDRSDNIPGYDGKMRNIMAPPKFLEPVIQDLQACETELAMYDVVELLYLVDGGLGLEQMHINAQLLYIQKKVDDKWISPVHQYP